MPHKPDVSMLTLSFLSRAWYCLIPWCSPRTWLVSHITSIGAHCNCRICVNYFFRIAWATFEQDVIFTRTLILIEGHNIAWQQWSTPRTCIVSHIANIGVFCNCRICVHTFLRCAWSHIWARCNYSSTLILDQRVGDCWVIMVYPKNLPCLLHYWHWCSWRGWTLVVKPIKNCLTPHSKVVTL